MDEVEKHARERVRRGPGLSRGARRSRSAMAARYKELAAEWDRRRKNPDRGAGDWMVDKPDLPMDAVPFLLTLRRLGYVTQDRRYTDLHRDLIKSGLIDRMTGKWSHYGTVLANPDTRMICVAIEEAHAAGMNEREALAEATVELNLEAASFDAAVTSLRRLLREYRKNLGQKPT
jgi:hypothetical protein